MTGLHLLKCDCLAYYKSKLKIFGVLEWKSGISIKVIHLKMRLQALGHLIGNNYQISLDLFFVWTTTHKQHRH